jgi:AcrR family transcriptional regulator
MMLKKKVAAAAEVRDGSEATLSTGQRERNKRDKLLRIRAAARELFVSKGYDDTTTREIAARASVGMGTVFTYADNKRDLLFLIANDDLAEVMRCAAKEASREATMLEGVLTFFRWHYEYFARQPELSRLMLREMVFYDSGMQANRFKAMREEFMSLLNERVRLALQRGEIVSSEEPTEIGWVLFCLYQVGVRRWLAEGALDVAEGMESLERAIRIVLTGLRPRDAMKPVIAAGKGNAMRPAR